MKNLPFEYNFYTQEIIKKTISANKALAELNWIVQKIPNTNILVNSLSLQEAKDSSEIESIITTHDELYKARVNPKYISQDAKEVQDYAEALLQWYKNIQRNWILTSRDIRKIQETLEWNSAWFRTQSWTTLKNEKTWEIVYTPPQDIESIQSLMDNLEQYINKDIQDIDPLIKMAIIHHQFESIHPFLDWNGRTWRIINILYLVLQDLLDVPILYMSKYLIQNKSEYYRLLQDVRDTWKRHEWIMYMLSAVEETALLTIKTTNEIWQLMWSFKSRLKKEHANLYSKDLLEILFSHPYTKIDFLVHELSIHRETASKYLNTLSNSWYLEPVKLWNTKYYINKELFMLLQK